MRTSFGEKGGLQVKSMPRLHYPQRVRWMHKGGRVLLLLALDHFGSLEMASILENAGFGFDKAALRAIDRARFFPAEGDGFPVACQAVLPVFFI